MPHLISRALISLLSFGSLAGAAVSEPGEDPSSDCNNGGTDCPISTTDCTSGDCPPYTETSSYVSYERCPESPEPSYSKVNPFSGLYIHDVLLYRRPVLPSEGCSPCGSGGAGGVPRSLPSVAIARFYRSRNGGYYGSLGENHFLAEDQQIRLDWSTADGTNVTVRLFDPSVANYKRYFIEKVGADAAIDGKLHELTGAYREVRLRDAAGAITASGAQAAMVEVVRTDGVTWVFEVINDNGSATVRMGRMIRVIERTGVVAAQYAYRYPATATLTDLGNDRARLWQLNSLVAADGTSAQFTYDTVKRSGRYPVTRIDLPNGSATTFAYTGNLLTANTLPDGSVATFAVSNDPVLQKVKSVIRDPAAQPGHQFKTVWWTNTSYKKADGTTIGQTYGQLRRIDNGAGEISQVLWSGPSAGGSSAPTYIWHADRGLRFYEVTAAAILPTARRYAPNYILGQDPETAVFSEADFFATDTTRELLPAQVDALGRRKSSTFDFATRNNAALTDFDGLVRTSTYNAFGMPLYVKDKDGRVTTSTYDGVGNRLTQTVGAAGEASTWSWEYDARGLTTAAIDANGNRTDYTYDAAGRLATVIEPADRAGDARATRTFSYNAAGQLTSQADASGRTVTYLYDARNRRIQSTYSDGSTETTTYGAGIQSGLVVSTTDRNGAVTARGYDAAGRLIRTETASGTADAVVEDCTWVPGSNDHKATCIRGGETTTYAYDGRGRLVGTTVWPTAATALTTTTAYNALSFPVAMVDPYGRATYQLHDALGRVMRRVRELVPGGFPLVALRTAYLAAQPSTLAGTDIGAPVLSGSSLASGGTITVQGAGAGIGGTADQFQFDRQALLGDDVWTVRVVSQSLPSTSAKAGIMVRGGEAANAAYTFLHVSNSKIALHRRLTGGTAAIGVASVSSAITFPVWLRMSRVRGQTIAAWSQDGVSWTTLAAMAQEMDPSTRIGFAVTSSTTTALSTAVFDNLFIAVAPAADQAVISLAEEAVVRQAVRQAGANPAYVIEDMEYDAVGRVIATVDGRGTRSEQAYDSQGRLVHSTEAGVGVATIAYDAQGNRQRVTDARGAVTFTTYTGRNLVASVTEAEGTSIAATTTWTYTPTRKPATVRDALDRVTVNAYGVCCDRLVSVTDPLNFQTKFTYDPVGNRVTVTDGNNLTTVTAYDLRRRPRAIANPAGETTTLTYFDVAADLPQAAGLGLGVGADGSATSTANALGEKVWEIRDGVGRVLRRVDGLGKATTLAYDATVLDGGATLVKTTSTDPLNQVTSALADGAGRVRVSVDALGKRSTAGYDANGNRVTGRDANGIGQDCVFDARNRDVSCTDTAGATTSRSYDDNGNVVRVVDALGETEVSVFDLRNRKESTTDRIGAMTVFHYDAVSNLLRITDAEGGITDYVYDARNLLTSEVFPTGQAGRTTRSYVYDAGRRLTKRTVQAVNAAGVGVGTSEATSYAYDAANRLTARTYPDGLNDGFAYDMASRLTTATSVRYANRVRRTYDAASRLTSEILAFTSGPEMNIDLPVRYGYDADDRVTTLTYPDGSVVRRDYTPRHELFHVWDGAQVVAARSYDDGGRLVQTQLGNGLTETRGYIANENLVGSIAVPGVTGFSYQYDATKRKTAELDGVNAGQSQRFGYDAQARVTNWKRTGTAASDPALATQTWTLSPVGDWSQMITDGVTQTRTHSQVHEALSITTGATTKPLSYDFKGNLTTDDQGQIFAWDPENRLRSAGSLAQGQGLSATYGYDALGRRVRKSVTTAVAVGATPAQITTTTFVSAGAQEVVEITGDLTAFNDPTADPEDAGIDPYDPATEKGARGSLLDDAEALRFNAQPTTTATPDGWVQDTGLIAVSPARGWSTAVSGVDRDHLGRPLYDSFLPVGTSTWRIPVANGTHAVVIMCGDADSRAQTNHLLVNGVAVTDPTPYDGLVTNGYETGSFDGYAITVNVTGGLLTVSAGTGALAPKVNFIEIGKAGSAADQTTKDRATAAADKATKDTAKPKAKTPPVVTRSIWGSYVDEVVAFTSGSGSSMSRYYVHSKHLWSPAAITDSTCAVVERYTYDATGRQTITSSGGAVRSKSAVGFDRGFTGQTVDVETGLNYVRSRMYSPTMGRFISRDPWMQFPIEANNRIVRGEWSHQLYTIRFRPIPGDGYKDGLNLYGAYYIPNMVDPSGMNQCWGQSVGIDGAGNPGVGLTPDQFNNLNDMLNQGNWQDIEDMINKAIENQGRKCKLDPSCTKAAECKDCTKKMRYVMFMVNRDANGKWTNHHSISQPCNSNNWQEPLPGNHDIPGDGVTPVDPVKYLDDWGKSKGGSSNVKFCACCEDK